MKIFYLPYDRYEIEIEKYQVGQIVPAWYGVSLILDHIEPKIDRIKNDRLIGFLVISREIIHIINKENIDQFMEKYLILL